MFGEKFEFNEQTMTIVEAIGRHMPGGFFIYKAAEPEELLYVNKALLNIYGCDSLEEFKALTGYTFRGMVHPEDYAGVVAYIEEQIEENDENFDYVEYRIIRKDGSVRWVDDYGHSTHTNAYGGIYYVFISDITEKREESLRLIEEDEKQKEEQNKLITALASDYWSVYYIELDTDEGVCYQAHTDMNNALKVGEHFRYLSTFVRYANENITDAYREEFLRFIQPDSIREGLKENRIISCRYMINRNGKEKYEMIRFAGVRHPEDRDDHIVHAVGACFSDVDAETRDGLAKNRALSEALAAAEQANKAKTAFLSNMSHEIRTPMNAIIGLDNIALSDADISNRTKDYLEKIGISAHHLLSIINDILDMSRIESGHMIIKNEEFSFQKVMDQVTTIIGGQCHNKGQRFDCNIPEDIGGYYIGDDMKLKQILINILSNSVKFTPEGGNVSFTVEKQAEYEGNSTLRFVIKDNGIGISREYLPRIFDAFSQEDSSSTNQFGSTGLGMPITKSLVELMNGSIEVESEKGVGTTFVVTVPLKESDRKDSEDGFEELTPHEMVVLAIDDDPVACEHAKLVLGQVGISCDIALSGQQGIEMVKVRQARQEPYNLILVDWKMPEMDGIETTREIRRIVGHDSAIIILTSFNWDDVAEDAKQAGVDTFVPKPLLASNVMDEFKEAFKKKNSNEKNTGSLKGRRVLLAEDVTINAEIMIMVLSMRDIDVDHVENGKLAVERFAESPAGYYDAILMDMRMPVMDGLETTRTIRSLDREDAGKIPIIALTANAFDEDVQRSLQAGLNAHLSKPVEPDALFATLEGLIK